jgi:hypothetical protein
LIIYPERSIPGVADDLNTDLTVHEVYQALRQLGQEKAPGNDDITIGFLALSTKLRDEDNHTDLNNPIFQLIFLQLQLLWRTAHIPTCLAISEVVHIPKKDGDATIHGDYRGISLMNLTLKLLVRILACRLSRVWIEHNLLSTEQVGFMTGEEGLGQVAALDTLVRRRHSAGKATICTFLDLRKALDTVPHEALFQSVKGAGIHGRFVDLVTSMYKNSSVRPQNGLDDTLNLEAGVRQGCCLSPLLFNLFIEPLVKGANVPGFTGTIGVQVPVERTSTRRLRYQQFRMLG